MTTKVEKKKKNVAVTRATGEKLLAGLLSRVEEVNRGDYAYYVGAVVSWWNELWWPLREVIMFLTGGSKALSIHTMPGDVYKLMKDPTFQYRLLFGRLRSAPDNTHY